MLLALSLAQTILLTEAISLSGTAPIPLPFGHLVLLRSATDFASLVGGTVARTATVVQFYQRHGLFASVAVSSGVIYSIAGFLVQIVLAGIALALTFDEFNFSSTESSESSDGHILLVLLIIVVAVGAVVGVLFAIPKVRRIIDSRVRPELASAWANLRSLATNPSKLFRILGGQVLSQALAALALGASLHAVGGSASFGALLVVCTASSFLGGLSPVPGGMGVMEAAYISGLTLAGVPEDIAIGATVIYRLFTAYLPCMGLGLTCVAASTRHGVSPGGCIYEEGSPVSMPLIRSGGRMALPTPTYRTGVGTARLPNLARQRGTIPDPCASDSCQTRIPCH